MLCFIDGWSYTSYDTDLTTAGQKKETRLFPWMRETGVGLSNNNR